MMAWARAAGLIATALLLAGCAQKVADFNKEPLLSPVGSGLQHQPVFMPTEVTPVSASHNGNSLWQDRASDLFKDRRARRVGDVITVKIKVDDEASLDNTSKRSRDGSHTLGIDLSHAIDWRGAQSEGTADLSSNVNSNSEHDSSGAVERSESIDLRIAAVVSGVLPNGNLLVQGSQELRVNYELRVLMVSGVIDVRDIAPDNTVSYDRMAEARMSVGGRGRITEIQQPAWGYQLIDLVSPF